MKNTFRLDEQLAKISNEISKEIDTLISDETELRGDANEFNRLNELLELQDKIAELKKEAHNDIYKKWYKRLDVNNLFTGAVSITSILIVLNYEKADIVTSKAIGMATKWIGK